MQTRLLKAKNIKGSLPVSRTRSRSLPGFLLTLPTLLVILATVLYPIGWSFKISLSSSDDGIDNAHSIGLGNYIHVLSSSNFQTALLHTFGFVIATIIIELIIGFAAALALNRTLPGHRVFRLIYTLPLMMAPVVAGLQWRWLFTDQYGVINYILKLFGIKGPLWLASDWGAKSAILIANVWLATPFVILVLLAGLSSLPEELYEAARLDGASSVQIFRSITLPLLRPVLLLILVVRLTDAIRVFDIVYIMTQGGPGNSTEVLSSYIYKQTFNNLQFGQGSAASFIVMIIVVLISYLCFRSLTPKEGGTR